MKAKLVKESLFENIKLNDDQIEKIANILVEIIKGQEEDEGRKMPKAYFMRYVDDIIDDLIDSELNLDGPPEISDIKEIKMRAAKKIY